MIRDKKLGIEAVLLSASVLLAACAAPMNHVHTASHNDVCRSYGTYVRSPFFQSAAYSYRTEIFNRRLLTSEEWSRVNEKRVAVGDSICAMYAALGAPDRENRSANAYGSRTQHVFNAGYTYIRPTYIYTDGTKVVAIQD